jgi:ABC-2 type transport system permease protein
MDSIIYYNKAFAFPALPEEINIDDMLFKYGVRINSDLLQDLFCSNIRLVSRAPNGREQYHTFKWFYFPILVSHNNHVINKYIDYIHTNFISSIDTVGKRPLLKRTILLTTSEFSRKIPVNFPLEITLDQVNNIPPKSAFNQQNIPVAVLLEGRFHSAFEGRIVKDMLPKGAKFIALSKPTKMIVVSDGDIARNEVTSDGRVMPLGFDHYSGLTFPGNKQFLVNAVNYLCGDKGLMVLRARQFKLRVLDKQKVANYYYLWQIINIFVPILIFVVISLLLTWKRIFLQEKSR